MDQHATDVLTDWAALRSGVAPVWARYTDLVVERATGSWIETIDGERYLDFLSGISVSSVGHCHPKVVEAIRAQAGELIHVGNLYFTEPMSRLADRLAEGSLGGGVFFTNSGAEAVEAALKTALLATGRPRIAYAAGGYHGTTLGALGCMARGLYRDGLDGVLPAFREVAFGDAAALEAALAPGDVAAFIVEPIQMEAGAHIVDGRVAHSLLLELFTDAGFGTKIRAAS